MNHGWGKIASGVAEIAFGEEALGLDAVLGAESIYAGVNQLNDPGPVEKPAFVRPNVPDDVWITLDRIDKRGRPSRTPRGAARTGTTAASTARYSHRLVRAVNPSPIVSGI